MTQRGPAGAGMFDVAIVGGGFSGLMVALNASRAKRGMRLVIVERRDAPGRGTAYAERPQDAILNVPAGLMGAFADDPNDFARWLGDADPAAFLPRHLYGRYLQALLAQAKARGDAVFTVCADVADLRAGALGWTLLDANGMEIATAASVVLALGAPQPADIVADLPVSVRDHPAYVRDPWAFLSAPAFASAGDILVAGSGLTALDIIAAFARSGAPNRLRIVSRRGRFPLAHASTGHGPPSVPISAGHQPARIGEIVALVRSAAREAIRGGGDWRAVMDGLRPKMADLWCGLDLAERRRFLRHVRPIFDPHRHRAPAQLLAYADALAQRGQLDLNAARIIALQPDAAALEVVLQARGGGAGRTLRVAQLINCSGPANDYCGESEPLVVNLLARGEICPDATGLGLRARRDGRLIDATGRPSDSLFTIGWPMRGTLFETTAVRELREHAATLGNLLAAAHKLC